MDLAVLIDMVFTPYLSSSYYNKVHEMEQL